MKIRFHGGGGADVTGFAYLAQTRAASVLVDLGLFQGADKPDNYHRVPKREVFERLNAVVLTHAQLDHTFGGYSGHALSKRSIALARIVRGNPSKCFRHTRREEVS